MKKYFTSHKPKTPKPKVLIGTLPRNGNRTVGSVLYTTFAVAQGKKGPFGAVYVPVAAAEQFVGIALYGVEATPKYFGKTVGRDSKGRPVRIGDVVKHTEKRPLKNGIVIWRANDFLHEKAAYVVYPPGTIDGFYHHQRFSGMVRVGQTTPEALVKARVASKILVAPKLVAPKGPKTAKTTGKK